MRHVGCAAIVLTAPRSSDAGSAPPATRWRRWRPIGAWCDRLRLVDGPSRRLVRSGEPDDRVHGVGAFRRVDERQQPDTGHQLEWCVEDEGVGGCGTRHGDDRCGFAHIGIEGEGGHEPRPEHLISSIRSVGGQRRYHRDVLRRVAFIRVAQRVGLSLADIRTALSTLPEERTPTVADRDRLSRSWLHRLTEQIQLLVNLRDELTSCIGCGCLSFKACRLYNPHDAAATLGDGPRYLLGDHASDLGVMPDPATSPS